MSELDKLIEAVEAGDERISSYLPTEHEAVWPKFYLAMRGSLDAALELHEALLPDRAVAEFRHVKRYAHESFVYVHMPDGHKPQGSGPTPARAWLLAILRAYRSVQP